jgi:hypothetical protein
MSQVIRVASEERFAGTHSTSMAGTQERFENQEAFGKIKVIVRVRPYLPNE